MKPSEYLLSKGWLPAPSSAGPAWEHVKWSFEVRWPEGFDSPVLLPQRWFQDYCLEFQEQWDEYWRNGCLEELTRHS